MKVCSWGRRIGTPDSTKDPNRIQVFSFTPLVICEIISIYTNMFFITLPFPVSFADSTLIDAMNPTENNMVYSSPCGSSAGSLYIQNVP